jgi:hypothetical protein
MSTFCHQYIKKKCAVQQKIGKRRIGAAEGAGVRVNSTISGLFYGHKKADSV